jgi:hypothetical protein
VQKVQKDGIFLPASLYASTLEIDPGGAVIYTYEKK